MKIISIISNLNKGGAEGNFFRVNSFYNNKKYNILIICLTKKAYYSDLFKDQHIEVIHLNLERGKITIKSLFQIFKIIKKFSPDVVQTWMYHSDLIGGVIAKIAGVKKIHWNVRHASLKIGSSKFTTIITALLCSIFSYFVPNIIIMNSLASKKFHKKFLYCTKKMKIINNGINTTIHKPDLKYYNYLDKLSGINKKFKIGMVARFDKQKGHLTFLESVNIIINRYKKENFYFFLIGKNIDNNAYLNSILKKKKIMNNVSLIGHQNNINIIMNSLDLHILSSKYGDSFPNVILESMAAGTPCIASNIGDSKLIINNDEFIFDKNNPKMLADTIIKISKIYQNYENWEFLKKQVRSKIKKNYNIDKMTSQYEQLF